MGIEEWEFTLQCPREEKGFLVSQGAQSKVQEGDWQVGMEREGISIFSGANIMWSEWWKVGSKNR